MDTELLVIPNERRLPSKRTGAIHSYITTTDAVGIERPVAVAATDTRMLDLLSGYGRPEPAPEGLEVVRFPVVD